MLVHSADGYLAATVDARVDHHTAGLLRWLVLGAAGLAALVLALSHAGSVGAAAPATYTTICINYFTCYDSNTGAAVSNTNSGYPTYTVPSYTSSYPTYTAPNYNSGYAPNSTLSTYFDPRYGVVSVVTDQYGNLIDVNAATGQRIFPIYPDYGNGFVGANYLNGNFFGVNPNFVNGCPAGNFSCLAANNGFFGCPAGNFTCLNANPFFGFPFGTGVFNGNATIVAPSGNPIVVGPPYRVKEVTPATTTTAVTVAPAPAPAAPAANYATALNAPSAPATAPVAATGSNVHVLSASPTTAPAATGVGGSDDHR